MDKEIEHPNRMGNLSCLLTMSDFAGAEERDKEIAISKFPKYIQWPFQEPKLEVPTIYKVYIRPM
jgi:hypothetical protein